MVGLLRSEPFQDVTHASGFDLHLGVRLCMLMLRFILAWSLHDLVCFNRQHEAWQQADVLVGALYK